MTGYSNKSGGFTRAFLFSNGAMSDLGTLPGGTSSVGYGINQSGQVTGQSDSGTSGGSPHAFLFSNNMMSDLGTLSGGTSSVGYGINQSGQVTGQSDTSTRGGSPHAFLFSNGTMSDLGTLPGGTFSIARGINQSGQVTGYSTTSVGFHAFLFSNGIMQDLNSLIPPNSGWTLVQAFGINDTGQIAGYGVINGAAHAFLLNPASVPFAVFKPQVAIDLDANSFAVIGTFTLGMGSDGIAPLTEPVQLKLGTFSTTIPAGSFKKNGGGFTLGRSANLAGTANPVTVGLTIGNDTGSVSITAFFE